MHYVQTLFWNRRKIRFTKEVYYKNVQTSTLNLALPVLQSHIRLLRKLAAYVNYHWSSVLNRIISFYISKRFILAKMSSYQLLSR